MNSEKQSTNLQMTLREVNRVGERQKNVPKIRFKGYEDAWEQSELGEVLCELYNGQTPSRFREENWNGDINWLTSGELNRGTVYKTIEKITRIGQVDANLRIVPEGVFVMAITGLEAAGTRGNCAILGIPTTLNQSCMALFPKDNILFTGFLFQWYKKNGEKYGLVYPQGTKQRSYNAELIKKLPIAFPDYDEQKRLSTILRKLDKSLTLYQDLIEGLQKMKKTILSKMFPKDGEDVPEIRFKGFTDAWEQRKLSDVADRFDNLRVPISAADRIPGKTPYYGANGIQDYVDGYTHDGEFLLVAEDGANDLEDYPVNYVNGKIWVNNHAHVIQSKPDIALNSFLMYAIKQIKMNQFIVGGSRAKLNAEVMMSLPITIPDIKEQLFIGDYFQGIDNLITLHQRKLDELKNMKKTLLQQMFV